MRPGEKRGTAMRKLFILIMAISLVVSAATPAAAAVEGLLARSADGNYHLYDYQELLNSYALKLIGNANGLYEDYSRKSPAAFLHSDGILIDYQDTVDYYAALVITGQKFDFNSFATGPSAKEFAIPVNLFRVTVSQGQLISQKINNNSQALINKVSAPAVTVPTATTPPTEPTASAEENSAEGTLIVAASQVSLERAKAWAVSKSAHPRFIEIAPLYWEYGQRTGICPEVLYAQSAHETRYGHFTGQVPPAFNNWAGIKTANAAGDKPEDHQQFATPEDGVRAHFNHMAAYVGLNPLGEPHGRYFVVKCLPWSGTIKTVEELSGKWAPSATYHQRIVLFLSEMNQ
jgi:hypothetical protein